MNKLRACRLVGGPYKGWFGDFVDKGQKVALFGPPGGKSFVYRRQPEQKGQPVAFRYDGKATAEVLAEKGFTAEEVAEVAHMRRPPRKGTAALSVQVIPEDGYYVMRARGDEVARLPMAELPDREAVRQWVAAVFLPNGETKPEEAHAVAN